MKNVIFKALKKTGVIIICLSLCFGCLAISSSAETSELPKMNIALGKKVTVSDLEGGFNADGTPVYAAFDPPKCYRWYIRLQ